MEKTEYRLVAINHNNERIDENCQELHTIDKNCNNYIGKQNAAS